VVQGPLDQGVAYIDYQTLRCRQKRPHVHVTPTSPGVDAATGMTAYAHGVDFCSKAPFPTAYLFESQPWTRLHHPLVSPSGCHPRLDGVIPSRLASTGKRKEQAHPRQRRLSGRLRQPNSTTGESIRFHTTSPESPQQHAGSQAKKGGHCRQQSRR
jgi:hypothetical protein